MNSFPFRAQSRRYVQPADHMVDKLIDLTGTSYTAHPLLVTLPKPTLLVDHADDSDIQHNYDPVPGAPEFTFPPWYPNSSAASSAIPTEPAFATPDYIKYATQIVHEDTSPAVMHLQRRQQQEARRARIKRQLTTLDRRMGRSTDSN